MSTNIYLDNKYTKTYYKLIQRAQNRPKPTGYIEKHHIIPKCITKFLNLPESDKVPLTFKEHWVCHHLLMKMLEYPFKGKMYYAFVRMGTFNGKNGRVINAKMFERIKIINNDLCSGMNSPFYGKKHKMKENTKEKLSKIATIYFENPENKLKHSKLLKIYYKNNPEHKLKHSKLLKNYYKNPENKKKASKAQKKRFQNPEQRKKTADAGSKINWKIIFPNGEEKIIKNLNQFCKENKLSSSSMYNVAKGSYKQHKGYRCFKNGATEEI